MSEKITDKYFAPDSSSGWKESIDDVRTVVSQYCMNVIRNRDDLTRRQIEEEFWQRIAKYYGFEISWKREIYAGGNVNEKT